MTNLSRRDIIAIFSGKCYLLYQIVYYTETSAEDINAIIESMFNQSLQILGYQ